LAERLNHKPIDPERYLPKIVLPRGMARKFQAKEVGRGAGC
jgi:hypothetical protein